MTREEFEKLTVFERSILEELQKFRREMVDAIKGLAGD